MKRGAEGVGPPSAGFRRRVQSASLQNSRRARVQFSSALLEQTRYLTRRRVCILKVQSFQLEKVAYPNGLPVPFPAGLPTVPGRPSASDSFSPGSPVDRLSTSDASISGLLTPFHGISTTPLPTPDAQAFTARWSEKKRSHTPRPRPPSPPRRDKLGSSRKEGIDLFWKSQERKFEKLEEIGNGHFSHVFKVREKATGRLFAIKLVKQPTKRSIVEWQHALLLQDPNAPPHPNLVHYVDCLTPTNSHSPVVVAFLLEFVSGETLERKLEREDGPIPEQRLWCYIRDLLEALAHIHAHDMVHLDMKPENIIVTVDGRLKLGDFGQMIRIGDYDPNESMEGDVRYMAPELLDQSLDHITYATDMFSLGVMIWEMATNLEVPLGGCELWNVLRSGEIPEEQLGHLSIQLQRLIKSLLCPLPFKRPSAAELLRMEVFTEMENSAPVSAIRGRGIRRQSQPDSKKRQITSTPLGNPRGPLFAPQSLQSSHVATRLDFSDLDSPSKRRKRSSSTESSDFDDSEPSSSRSNSLGPLADEMDVDIEISFLNPKNLLDEFTIGRPK